MRQHNFFPGPATLPFSVLEEASEGLKDYQGLGVSIAEISHRSPIFTDLLDEANALVRSLYGLSDEYEVLWLPGGASTQLTLAPMNLTEREDKIAFVDTGFWAQRSFDAAANESQAFFLDSSKSTNYDSIPKDWTDLQGAKYLHVVSNETIDGTQYHEFPEIDIPIVADMTSDFLTRPLPLEKFGLIFASAQKNFGIAGITCLIIDTKFLPKNRQRNVPKLFDYRTQIAENSLYHTIPTFPVYVALLMLRWIKAHGGLSEMQRLSQIKSSMIYNEIDRNPLFNAWVQPEDRSLMNPCFKGLNQEIDQALLTYLEQNEVIGIKGFPTKGGFRASIYNGQSLESVKHLVELLQSFKF
ncbi:3-phosphoserine/phosphohydroxythreonine transaminase [Aquirufa sp. ROCK2-A2]